MATSLMQPLGAASDLGLGSMLGNQQQDETEEEKRKRKLGMSPLTQNSLAVQTLFGAGNTGMR